MRVVEVSSREENNEKDLYGVCNDCFSTTLTRTATKVKVSDRVGLAPQPSLISASKLQDTRERGFYAIVF